VADRTVSVELVLKTDQYKTEAEAAKLKTEALDRTVVELDRDINKIPADATKAGAALDLMGAGAKKAGDDTGKLDARIAELKDSIKGLGAEFDKTGDPALLKKFRADSSELSGLTKMRTEFEKLPPVLGDLSNKTESSTGWFGRLRKEVTDSASSFADLAKQIGPLQMPGVLPTAIGAGIALSPLLLGAVGGAVSTAAAGGVAGAGVAGAVMGDPARFKAEWGAAAGEVKKDFLDATTVFTGPTLSAIKTIGPLIDSWHIDKTFEAAAGFVQPLVSGIEGFTTEVVAGVSSLVKEGGPAMTVIAQDLPLLGEGIKNAFDSIAGGAQGGAAALGDVIKLLTGAIELTGALIGTEEKAYQSATGLNIRFNQFLADNQSWLGPLTLGIADFALQAENGWNADKVAHYGAAIDGVTVSTDLATTAIDDFGKIGGGALYTIDQRARDTLDMVQRMEKSFDEAANAELKFRNASVASAQSLADLEKGWKHVKNALDINTQAGRDNVTLIDKVITESVKQRDAAIAAGGGTADAYAKADAVYRKQIDNLQALLTKLLGSKKAAEDFLNAFKDKTITLTVKVNQVGSVTQQGVISGGVPVRGAFAEGGDPPPGLAWVGEKGPELVRFNGSEHVYTSSQSRAMMASSGPSGSSGASQSAVAVSLVAGSGANLTPLGSLINQMIRDGLIVVKASQVRPGV
jgi:hypothetical protein